MIDIVNICVRESLILFPVVLGVGLLYTHMRTLDVSVDGITILSGIACAFAWKVSQSYAFSLCSGIICGILCSWFVCVLVSKLSVAPIMAGLIFSVAIHSISTLMVGESVLLEDTSLLPGFTKTPLWLVVLTIMIAVGAYQFFTTRLGGEIRAHGANPLFGSSYDPFSMHMVIYGIAGGLYGLGASLYVHSQGLARSGGGFEFLILALCSYLSVDRLMGILQQSAYRARRRGSGPTKMSLASGRFLANIIQSPPAKALAGIIFFQHLVFLSILYAPNPSIWKLIMSLILACSLINAPHIFSQKRYKRSLTSKDNSRSPRGDEILIESMTKSYDLGIERRIVFEQMSSCFGKGISVVRGPNGSGKSTLLELLYGTIPCDVGRIIMSGKDVTNLLPFQRPVFLLRQNPFHTLAGKLSVIENLDLATTRNNKFLGGLLSSERTLNHLFNSLSKLGISPLEPKSSTFWHKPAITLSGGQATCVAFYMALLSDKQIIMADEPSTGLDSENFSRLLLILRALKIGKTVIITTHDHRLDSIEGTHFIIQGLKLVSDEGRNGNSEL